MPKLIPGNNNYCNVKHFRSHGNFDRFSLILIDFGRFEKLPGMEMATANWSDQFGKRGKGDDASGVRFPAKTSVFFSNGMKECIMFMKLT